MSLRGELLRYSTLLARKGFVEEASLVERTAHYVPEDTEGVPSFFRRNLDYGEGFYYGNMNEKPGIKEWLKKHKGKGPNFLKKKKEALKKEAHNDAMAHQYLLENDPEYRILWKESESLRSKIQEFTKNKAEFFDQNKIREANEIGEAVDQLQAYLDKTETALSKYRNKHGKKAEEKSLTKIVEDADRLINPKTLIDHFRIALLQKDYAEAGKFFHKMSPEEKSEAQKLAEHYHKAGLKGFIKHSSVEKA